VSAQGRLQAPQNKTQDSSATKTAQPKKWSEIQQPVHIYCWPIAFSHAKGRPQKQYN